MIAIHTIKNRTYKGVTQRMLVVAMLLATQFSFAQNKIIIHATGVANSGVDTIWRVAGKDSIFYTINGTQYQLLDSTGANINIYNSNGTLNSTRTVSTAGHATTWYGNTTEGFSLTVGNTNSFNGGISGYAVGSGSGVQANSSSGYGVWGISTTGIGGVFNINPSSTNSIAEVARLYRTTSGTAASGIGGYLGMFAENSNGGANEIGRLAYKWTDVTFATRTGQVEIWSTRSGTSAVRLIITDIPTYADDTAAGAAGLATGTMYKTSAGVLMIKL